MESNHNHLISQMMNPNNKIHHLTDGVEITVPFSSFNLLPYFCCIVCKALMSHTTPKHKHSYTYTHIERERDRDRQTDEAHAYVLLLGNHSRPLK